MPRRTKKRAKPASADADIGIINIAVNHIGDDGPGVLLHPYGMRHLPEFMEIGVAVNIPGPIEIQSSIFRHLLPAARRLIPAASEVP